jgi:hypothetical protein
MFVSLSATHGACVNSGADWLSQSAIPNQNAGCSWKFQVPPVPAWFGITRDSLGTVISYRFEFPEPARFE